MECMKIIQLSQDKSHFCIKQGRIGHRAMPSGQLICLQNDCFLLFKYSILENQSFCTIKACKKISWHLEGTGRFWMLLIYKKRIALNTLRTSLTSARSPVLASTKSLSVLHFGTREHRVLVNASTPSLRARAPIFSNKKGLWERDCWTFGELKRNLKRWF